MVESGASKDETGFVRRTVSSRAPESVDRLLDAAIAGLQEVGYDRLSLRSVCRQAGLTHATAYTHFSSKQHMVAEAYWRRIQQWCATPVTGDSPRQRLSGVFTELATLMAEQPALSAAAMPAVLTRDPDVDRLRTAVGSAIYARVREAVGVDTAPGLLDALRLMVSGAMLESGMDYATYDAMAQRLTAGAELLLGQCTDLD